MERVALVDWMGKPGMDVITARKFEPGGEAGTAGGQGLPSRKWKTTLGTQEMGLSPAGRGRLGDHPPVRGERPVRERVALPREDNELDAHKCGDALLLVDDQEMMARGSNLPPEEEDILLAQEGRSTIPQ